MRTGGLRGALLNTVALGALLAHGGTLRTAGTAVESCLCTVRMLPRTFCCSCGKNTQRKQAGERLNF